MLGLAKDILAELRGAGWAVAVHNDYRLDGQAMTFWLFTHTDSGRFIRGEGRSDQLALEQVWAVANATIIAAKGDAYNRNDEVVKLLRRTSDRLKIRINSAKEKAGSEMDAVVGPGIGLSYSFAQEIEYALIQAAAMLGKQMP